MSRKQDENNMYKLDQPYYPNPNPTAYPWQCNYPQLFQLPPLCETLNKSTKDGPRFIKVTTAEFIPDDWVIGAVYRIQQLELGSRTEFKMNNLAFLQEKSPEKLVFMTVSQDGETATITITAQMMCDNQPIAIFAVQ